MKQLLKLIPSSVRIKKDVSYEVVWLEKFPNLTLVGDFLLENNQIVIKKGESPTETFKTYLHECIHAVSLEDENLNLTEKQVRILEDELFRVMKLNKIFDILLKGL